MTVLAGMTPREARTAIVLGAIRVRARQRLAALGLPGRPHPMPDLTGQSPEVIVEALIGAIVAAHRADDPDLGTCVSCAATIELASKYGDPTGMEWPDPVRRLLADVIDETLRERDDRTK